MTQKGKLKNKTIFYISHNYKDFIKDPIEILSKEFKQVYVFVRHKPIADLLMPISKMLDMFKLPSAAVHSTKYKFNLKDLPINVKVISVSLWYLPFDFFYKVLGRMHYKKLKQILSKLNVKPDIVHAHMFWSAGYVGMRIAKDYGVPFVVTGHGSDVYEYPFKSEMWNKRIKEIIDSADVVTTVSKKNKEIIDSLVKGKDVQVIANGFKEKVFKILDKQECRKELGLSVSEKIMVKVGHIIPIKGDEYLIKALYSLKKTIPNIKLILIGNGDDREKIETMVKRYGLRNNVMFTGLISHEEIVKWLNAADLFVLPSLGEGNPTVMFESLACGLPFVGTKVGGIPEIITKDTGFVVESGDSAAIAKAIKNGLKRSWNRKVIREYALQFEWKEICKKYMRIYDSTEKDMIE